MRADLRITPDIVALQDAVESTTQGGSVRELEERWRPWLERLYRGDGLHPTLSAELKTNAQLRTLVDNAFQQRAGRVAALARAMQEVVNEINQVPAEASQPPEVLSTQDNPRPIAVGRRPTSVGMPDLGARVEEVAQLISAMVPKAKDRSRVMKKVRGLTQR